MTDSPAAGQAVEVDRLPVAHALDDRLGFGRTVASERAAPNMLGNMV